MSDEVTIDKPIAENARIDRKQLRDALRAIRELREAGVITKKGYDLLHPFAPRPKVKRPA